MNTEQAVGSSAELKWLKSSYSSEQGGNCVEVAVATGAVHVRDSKCVAGRRFACSPGAWSAFVGFAVTDTGVG